MMPGAFNSSSGYRHRSPVMAEKRDYYKKAVSFDALYDGLRKSCRNVRWKDSVVGYEFNRLENTVKLSNSLLNGTYHISPYQVFQIHEPKERTIVASRLVDRQFQRSLCDNGLYDDIAEHFIRDNAACQIGRGTDDALNRLKYQLRRYYRHRGCNGWVLKCDVKHFFQSIPHDKAKAVIRKLVCDQRAAAAVCEVIDSFDGDSGIGLGSQISQLIALAVLNDLDHFVKERLRICVYERYMDDFVLVHPRKEYLRTCWNLIENKLEEIGLTLNRKTCLIPLRQGFRFLQWKYVLTESGKVLMLMNPNKVCKFKQRIAKLWAREQAGTVAPGTTHESLRAFLANAKRGNTCRIQQSIITYYEKLTGGTYNDDKQRKVA